MAGSQLRIKANLKHAATINARIITIALTGTEHYTPTSPFDVQKGRNWILHPSLKGVFAPPPFEEKHLFKDYFYADSTCSSHTVEKAQSEAYCKPKEPPENSLDHNSNSLQTLVYPRMGAKVYKFT